MSAAPGKTTPNQEHYSAYADIDYKDFYLNFFAHRILEKPYEIGVGRALTDEDDINTWTSYVELGYKRPMFDDGELNAKVYYDYYKFDMKFEVFPEEMAEFLSGIPIPGFEPYPRHQGLHGGAYCVNTTVGTEITLTKKITDNIDAIGGVLYEKLKQDDVEQHPANANLTGATFDLGDKSYLGAPPQYLDGFRNITRVANWSKDEKRDVFALYTQGEFDLKKMFSISHGEALALTAGVRYDDYDDVGSTTNPRMGLVYAPTKKLYFKILYASAFRAPTFREMYNKNNPASIGNPRIEPEEISTIEGQMGYNFTKSIRGTITCYRSSAKDLIFLDENNIFQNGGKLEAIGVESELKIAFSKNKYAYLNFTFQEVEDTTNERIFDGSDEYTQRDFNPGNIPEIIVNLGINYDILENLILNATMNYLGERDRSEEKTFVAGELVQSDQRDPIDDIYLWSAAITYDASAFKKGLEFQIVGHNLLDEDYADPDESMLLEGDIPRPGRSFMARCSLYY